MTRYEAHIEKGWQERGIANVLVLRHRPGGTVDAGFFLVDCWCLGVKDAWSEHDVPAAWMEDTLTSRLPAEERERLHPACAKKLIEGAIAYAEALGFSPHRDHRKARKVLAGLDAALCPTEFTFGREGKPCYVAGPDDSAERIDRVIAILHQRCGPDGYEFVGLDSGEAMDVEEVRTELQAWLEEQEASVPRFYQVSGLVTGMQLCPQPLSPTKLMEALWGPSGRVWEDEQELRVVTQLLGDYWNSVADLIATGLQPGAGANERIIDVWTSDFPEEEDLGLVAAQLEWSIGFLRATTLWPEAWGDTLHRPDLAPHWELIRWWSELLAGDHKAEIAAAAAEKPRRNLDSAVLALARALRSAASAAS